MSLAVKATRSAAWMFATGITTRVAGLVGTLLVVRWISPGDYGEAMTAAIVVGTASTLSSLGIGQYVIVKAGGRRDLAFHATVIQLALGGAALVLLAVLRAPIAAWAHAPGIHRYLPALALSMVLDRLWLVPERALMREMRFRRVAVARSVGEAAYTGVSIAAAAFGWGGMAIAIGNVARSAVRALATIPAVDRRDWLEPCPLRRDATLEAFRFGLPIAVAHIAVYVAGKWDNLLVSSFFGPTVMAAYNLAYNLAWMAAAAVSEHVTDILVPSFVLADARRRPEGLLRGASLVALLTTPLCLGLAAVAPTLVSALFDERWRAVAPMLSTLSVAATLTPLLGLVQAYLQALDRPRLVMIVQVAAVVTILGSILAFGRLGPLWTCAAVGLGTALCLLFSARVVRAVDGIPVHRLLSTQLAPLVASVPMVGAVLAVRALLSRAGLEVRAAGLALEIAAGATAYVALALVLAGPVARDLLRLVRSAFQRGGAPAPAAEADPSAGA